MVVGAMKCATTTLHEQLSRQPGVFMTRIKEPCYFSDEPFYARGPGWYAGLFADAPKGALCGESSTHYTKMPTYPETVARIARDAPWARFIYVMRDPLERLLSHYRHERTVGRIAQGEDLATAIQRVPELVEYGRYAYQVEPYLETFSPDHVLPVFFTRLLSHPQEEMARIGRFLGSRERFRWDYDVPPLNVSSERLRPSSIRHALATAPLLTPLRQKFVPRSVYAPLKRLYRDRVETPQIDAYLQEMLADVFDADLALLGERLNVNLDCANFDAVTRSGRCDRFVPMQ